jgi:hypothetical protein
METDDPRGLVSCCTGLFFPVPHALPIAPALRLPFFLAPRRGPVFLLRLPLGPLLRLLPALVTAITLRGLLRPKAGAASLQQTPPRSWPAHRARTSGCLLIFGIVCRTFRKAHGRWSSQKLMPRRGTLIPLRGAAVCSPTADAAKQSIRRNQHSTSKYSASVPSPAGIVAFASEAVPTLSDIKRPSLSYAFLGLGVIISRARPVHFY